MCSARSMRHAWCSLRAGGRRASSGSHGKLVIESVVELISPTMRDHSAYINCGEQTPLTKVVLGDPYAQSRLDRVPETSGQTWALE